MKIKSILVASCTGLLAVNSASAVVTLSADFSVDDKGAFGNSGDGITQDTTGMNWTIAGNLGGLDADTTTNDFRVISGAFVIQDLGGQASLTTDGLTVGAGAGTINFESIIVLGGGVSVIAEFFRIFYSVNGLETDSTDLSTGGTGSFAFTASEGDVITAGFEANVNGANDGWSIPQVLITGVTPVPEPSSALFGAIGALALLLRRR